MGGTAVVHGITVGTNAFLTRRGARVALVTIQGFEAVFFIGRQTRRELCSLATTLVLPGFQAQGAAGGHLILEDLK